MDTPEKSQAETEQDQTPQMKDIRGEVTYIYANHSQVSASNWDIRVAFGEVLPTGKIEPRAGVVMSLHHAKAFIAAFSQVLEGIEEKIGKVNFQPSLTRLDS